MIGLLKYILPIIAFWDPNWTIKENVHYGPGNQQLADLYLLKDDKTHPVVILVHGGGWAAGDKKYLDYIAKKYAFAGFNAVAITYTLATPEPNTHWPTAEIDVKLALQWVKDNAKELNIDTNKIVVWGASAGGQLALIMATQPGVKVVVDLFGPSDFTDPAIHNMMKDLDVFGKQTYQQNPELYKVASPIFNITSSFPPTFIAHSIEDKVVPFSQSERLYDKLDDLKVKVSFFKYKGYEDPVGGHDVNKIPSWLAHLIDIKSIWFSLWNL